MQIRFNWKTSTLIICSSFQVLWIFLPLLPSVWLTLSLYSNSPSISVTFPPFFIYKSLSHFHTHLERDCTHAALNGVIHGEASGNRRDKMLLVWFLGRPSKVLRMLRRKVYHVQVGKESQTRDYNANLWRMYSGKHKCLIYITFYVKKNVFL